MTSAIDSIPKQKISTHVLGNEDILYTIFDSIPSSIEVYPAERQTLAHCAIVCHTFNGPATRVLWRDLRSLFPLWHLLAPDGLPYPHLDLNYGSSSVTSYLKAILSAKLYEDPTRWEHFKRYAQHVRSLFHHFDPRSSAMIVVHNKLLRAVLQRNGGRLLLPLLRTVVLSCPTPGDDSIVPLFTPELREAAFVFPCTNGTIADIPRILRCLRHSSPRLEKISAKASHFDLGGNSIHEVLSLENIKEVTLSSLPDIGTFHDFVTKPHLVSLTLDDFMGSSFTTSLSGPDAIKPILCPELRELTLKSGAPVLERLFQILRLPSLHSMRLSIVHFPEETDITSANLASCLSSFVSAVSVHNLQHLSLSVQAYPYEAFPLLDVLNPILALRELRSFHLTSDHLRFAAGDDELGTLAKAWTKLHTFEFGLETLALDLHNNGPTLMTLYHFFLHCPDLTSFGFPYLDFPQPGMPDVPVPCTRSSHPLTRLFLGERVGVAGQIVSEGDAERWARCLLALFPMVQPIASLKYWEEYDNGWAKVFRVLHSIRDQSSGLEDK